MKKNLKIPTYILDSLKIIDLWLSYKQVFSRIPGLSVGIVYKNDLVFKKGYGYSDSESKIKISPETNFRIASISKVFTATSVMQLYESGKLSLDDRISKFLNWFKSDKDRDLENITIRELLTHSSGISRDGNTQHWVDDKYPELNELIKTLKGCTTVQEPAVRFKYSNFGYSILGELVHKVSEKSYNEYVETEIFNKTDLTSTYPDYNAAKNQNLATGYGRDIPNNAREVFQHCQTNSMSSATGLISNVIDLSKIISAQFVGSGKLLSDQSKREMQRINWTRKTKGDNYGLGYETWYLKNKLIVGHGGGFPGFRTKIGMDTDSQIGIVVLTNSIDSAPWILMNGILNTIYKIKELNKKSGNTKLNLAACEGKYVNRWGETDIATFGNNLICFSPNEDDPLNEMATLIHYKGNLFKIESEEDFESYGEKAEFLSNPDGKVTGLKWGPNFLEKA